MTAVIIVGIAVLAFSLFSKRLERSVVTPPMIFAALGLALGAAGFDVIGAPISRDAIHILAEVTLVLVLFSDAARIDLRLLIRDHNLPIRMLVVGMPLAIVLGTVAAYWLPLGLGIFEAALLAAVLAPTDAALGQSVVSNAAVPVRIRQALNVESGLNDGIAVPLVFLFAMLAAMDAGGVGAAAGESADGVSFLGQTALQLVLGPLAGLAAGGGAGWLMRWFGGRGWMSMAFEGAAVLAAAALSFAGAEAIGGNGFIAAFVGGLIFGYILEGRCAFVFEFAESEGQVLVLFAFLAFGAVMVPEIAGHVDGWVVLYAVLSLTAVRMVPIALSLLGTALNPTTMGFVGWFGPRGLASILFGLLVVQDLDTPGAKTILITTIVTVSLSILLHGLSAAPFAKTYARLARQRGPCPEIEPVSDMPTRFGFAKSFADTKGE